MAKIGLLGGSFNPPHQGHLHISKLALKQTDLDEIWWLITPQNPFKSKTETAPLEIRLKMCQELAKNCPKIHPTDIEKNFHTTQTFNTLHTLKKTFPKHIFSWIMGLDNLDNFHLWGNYETIIKNHNILVFNRLKYLKRQKMLRQKTLLRFKKQVVWDAKFVQLRTEPTIYIFNTPTVHISSSQIRRIKHNFNDLIL
jgi:nicotinate-nucleotide adenylyltransferase